MTPDRRALLQGAASIGALSLAPWHSASAQTPASPAVRSFSPKPGDWKAMSQENRSNWNYRHDDT